MQLLRSILPLRLGLPRSIIFLLVFGLICTEVQGTKVLETKHFTTLDGLPSREVYDVIVERGKGEGFS